MSAESLRLFKKSVDGAYRNFSAKYGDAIEAVFDPVLADAQAASTPACPPPITITSNLMSMSLFT